MILEAITDYFFSLIKRMVSCYMIGMNLCLVAEAVKIYIVWFLCACAGAATAGASEGQVVPDWGIAVIVCGGCILIFLFIMLAFLVSISLFCLFLSFCISFPDLRQSPHLLFPSLHHSISHEINFISLKAQRGICTTVSPCICYGQYCIINK